MDPGNRRTEPPLERGPAQPGQPALGLPLPHPLHHGRAGLRRHGAAPLAGGEHATACFAVQPGSGHSHALALAA